MLDVKELDEVRVFEYNQRSAHGGVKGIVTSVRRSLFTVECEKSPWLSGDYRLENGFFNEKDSNRRVLTMKAVNLAIRKEDALEALKNHGVRINLDRHYSLEQIEQLAAVVNTWEK